MKLDQELEGILEDELSNYLAGDLKYEVIGKEGYGLGSRLRLKYAPNKIVVCKVPIKSALLKDLALVIPIIHFKGLMGEGFYFAQKIWIGGYTDGKLPHTILIQDVGFYHRAFIPHVSPQILNVDAAKKIFQEKKNWSDLLEKLNNDKEIDKLMREYLKDKATAENLKAEINHEKGEIWGQLLPFEKWGGTIIFLQSMPEYSGGFHVKPKFSLDKKLNLIERIAKHLGDYNYKGKISGSLMYESDNPIIRLLLARVISKSEDSKKG